MSAMTHTAGFQKFGDLQIESKEAGFTAGCSMYPERIWLLTLRVLLILIVIILGIMFLRTPLKSMELLPVM